MDVYAFDGVRQDSTPPSELHPTLIDLLDKSTCSGCSVCCFVVFIMKLHSVTNIIYDIKWYGPVKKNKIGLSLASMSGESQLKMLSFLLVK